MSYAEQRKQQRDQGQNHSRFDFSWEEGECPLLHSGLTTMCTKEPNRGQLSMQVYFSNGRYHCRLMDREFGEQAFIDLASLGTSFAEIEQAIKNQSLDWQPMRANRNGNSGF